MINPYLPFYSGIELVVDGTETLQNLTETMVHEIGHSLGMTSTVLDAFGFIDVINEEYINGPNAIEEYQKIIPGATSIPMGFDSGAHWDEDDFDTEIMTPISDPNSVISTLTVGLFEDIGYEVDYSGISRHKR